LYEENDFCAKKEEVVERGRRICKNEEGYTRRKEVVVQERRRF
jgi:hypothetical protein